MNYDIEAGKSQLYCMGADKGCYRCRIGLDTASCALLFYHFQVRYLVCVGIQHL